MLTEIAFFLFPWLPEARDVSVWACSRLCTILNDALKRSIISWTGEKVTLRIQKLKIVVEHAYDGHFVEELAQ